MFAHKIRVTLEFEPGKYIEAWRSIESCFIDIAFEPLDFPKYGEDRLLCSNGFTIVKVMKERKVISRLISDAIADELVKKMVAKDTVNGYPKHIGD